MTAPAVNCLRERLPGLHLIIQTQVPRPFLESRFEGPFDLVCETPDFGMEMRSAIGVLPEESHQRYHRLHDRLEQVITAETERLRALAPDLVLSNIPYVTMEAASRLGVPVIGLSSLNWADIYRSYCAAMPGASRIHREMMDCYSRAKVILRPQPAMPMEDFPHARAIGPIARAGRRRRDEVSARLGLGQGERAALVIFGGLNIALPLECWPRLPGWRWIMAPPPPPGRDDMVPLEALEMPTTDVLASCDALITKTGYGTFAEAAVNGVPTLFLKRPDWPEGPPLEDWLIRHARALPLDVEQMLAKELGDHLQSVLALPPKPPVKATGISEAADIMESLLAKTWLPGCPT
ncbi:hypothetical protein [Telmatospirillum sp. J64-1]|uniref:hypothetical protein n=1 Tax=Telmatospirillum sp. J64-1 TaxID=2502183 RepID=UPI00115F59E0|nr:hypothetical protein [Telmatospirillum sp. J64-1]